MSLIDIARALASEKDVPALLARILDSAIDITGAERGFLLTRGEDWNVAAARNMNQKEIARAQEKVSRTVLDRLRDKPLLLADAELPGAESVQTQKVRAICAVPIGAEGAVYLDHRKKAAAFLDADLESLGAFAGLAGILLENARLQASLAQKVEAQAVELADLRSMIGGSSAMKALSRSLEKAAASPYPVLLHGESGTGKELAARSIHDKSARKDGPFIAANCGAVQDSLLASELFGHEKGAFTGADEPRTGLFELADGGTLFLDEVGTMSREMQESLLRVLQEGEIRRVGSPSPRAVDVRIVAASNADLSVMADQGEFREDLYYRLNVIRIDLPPLRNRRDDIPMLVDFFLDRAATETGRNRRSVTPKALERLLEHEWPGNIRELENAVRRAVTMSENDVLDRADFDFLDSTRHKSPVALVHIDEYIRGVLTEYEGRMDLREIADRLGLSRKTLWEKKKKWGLL